MDKGRDKRKDERGKGKEVAVMINLMDASMLDTTSTWWSVVVLMDFEFCVFGV